MIYVASDLHGEYELFCRLLEKIRFSGGDTLYLCGDVIDKGPQSLRLLQTVLAMPEVHCIVGNHEHAFLQHYRALMEQASEDFDRVLARLQAHFPAEPERLDWELLDSLEEWPYYIEQDDFICVHAGVELDARGHIRSLRETEPEVLIYDRRFRLPEVRHNSRPCVFFGHTQTDCICGKAAVLAYNRVERPRCIADYDKIHLDTGTWKNGVMACFCVDTLSAHYVRRTP